MGTKELTVPAEVFAEADTYANQQVRRVKELLRAAHGVCTSDDLSVEITISSALMPTVIRFRVTSDESTSERDGVIEDRDALRS